jgi:hypothetical protein
MKTHHLYLLVYLSYVGWSHAEIYKRTDAEGHVTYSSEPIKGGKKLVLKPLPTMSGYRNSHNKTPEDFPRVDSDTQRSRDSTRRKILEDELSTEEAALATAREGMKKIEDNPLPLVDVDGVPFRNVTKQTERVKSAQDLITLHEQNIQALKTEISNLK